MSDKPQKGIKTTVSEEFTITFSQENTAVIDGLIENEFGVDRDDVVLNALILFYTLSQKAPNAKTLSVKSLDKTIIITIPR